MQISIDDLLEKSENKFLLSNGLGKRAKQINEGSLPYVDDFNPASPIVTAMKEIYSDKVKIKVLASTAKKIKEADSKEAPKKKLSLAKEYKKKKK